MRIALFTGAVTLAACSAGGGGAGADDEAGPTDAPAPGSAATLSVITDGLGAGVMHVSRFGELLATCAGTCDVPVVVGESYWLTVVPFGSSELGGWNGCATVDGNSCEVAVAGDVAVTASLGVYPGVSWARTATRDASPTDLSAASNGVVVAGGTGRSIEGRATAIWFAHYRADGTRALEIFDDASPGEEHGDAVAVDPQGGVVVVAELGANGSESVRVRRYSPAGVLDWSVPFNGRSGGALEIDSTGNLYFTLIDGGYAIVSLEPTGSPRWRVNLPNQVFALGVRDGRLVAAGANGGLAWLGTFALDGAPAWAHTLPAIPPGVLLTSVAIDGDGDIAYGGAYSGFPNHFYYGVVDADGSGTRWSETEPDCASGAVAVTPDDSVVVWTVFPARVRRYTEGGGLFATELMGMDVGPGGFVVDATGAAYLTSGQSVYVNNAPQWPVIERIP